MQKKKLKNQMKLNKLKSSKLRSKLRAASDSEGEDNELGLKVQRSKSSKSQRRPSERKERGGEKKKV